MPDRAGINFTHRPRSCNLHVDLVLGRMRLAFQVWLLPQDDSAQTRRPVARGVIAMLMLERLAWSAGVVAVGFWLVAAADRRISSAQEIARFAALRAENSPATRPINGSGRRCG